MKNDFVFGLLFGPTKMVFWILSFLAVFCLCSDEFFSGEMEQYDANQVPQVYGAEAWGLGLSLAASGRPSVFFIQPLDEFGDNITAPGLGNQFVVLVEPPSMRGAVMEKPNGVLQVILVHEWGTLVNGTVSIMLNKTVHVAASPYRIQLVPYYSFAITADSEPFATVSETAEREPGLETMRAAFATLVVSDPFVMGALVLMHTLRKSGTAFPLVVMVTDAVSEEKLELMRHHGLLVRKVERIGNPKGSNLEEKAWDSVYTKCRAWELVEFEKVLFMDSDQIVLKNIDHLFLKPAFSAVPDLAPPTVFNSGLMLLEPSKEIFSDMMRSTAEMKSYDEGDQGFLNEYFWGRWHMLPFTYNFLKSKTGNPDAYYWFLNMQRWSIHVIHHVGVKPWVCSPHRDCGTGFPERHIPILWHLWWGEMEEVCATGHIDCLDPTPYDLEDVRQVSAADFANDPPPPEK